MHLYLIRHAQSASNLPEHHGYITDLGLSAIGEKQISYLSAWMQKKLPSVTHLYTSSLKRAELSANVLAKIWGIMPQVDNRLREVGTCRSDGQILPLPVRWNGFLASTRPEDSVADGAESWVDFLERIAAFMLHLQVHPASSVIVCVCHSGTLEAINDWLLQVPTPRAVEWASYHSSLTHWQYLPMRGEPWIMHSHNMIQHLVSEPSLLTGVSV